MRAADATKRNQGKSLVEPQQQSQEKKGMIIKKKKKPPVRFKIKKLEHKHAGTAMFWIQNQRPCNSFPAVQQQGNNNTLKTPDSAVNKTAEYDFETTECIIQQQLCVTRLEERESYVQYLIFSQPHRVLLIYTDVNYCE